MASIFQNFCELMDERSVFSYKKSNDSIMLSGRLAGVRPDEVNLETAGDTLLIKWESKRGGRGESTFRVGRDYDTSSVDANMSDGLLELKIPLAAEKTRRKISISSRDIQSIE